MVFYFNNCNLSDTSWAGHICLIICGSVELFSSPSSAMSSIVLFWTYNDQQFPVVDRVLRYLAFVSHDMKSNGSHREGHGEFYHYSVARHSDSGVTFLRGQI